MGPEHTPDPIELLFENGSRIVVLSYDQHGTFVTQETDEPELGNVDLTEIL